MTAPNTRVTEVTVCVVPEGHVDHHLFGVTVVWRGDESFAVMHMGYALGADGEWDYEPRPVGRFTYDEAMRLAVEVAPQVRVNGRTAAQVVGA